MAQAGAFALAAVLSLLAVGALDGYRARAKTKAGRADDPQGARRLKGQA
ncbi:hypothetical protein OG379_18860 [Streptomyces sp. NBC_01166]|nr:hypothetical protein OG379_18860 [Streptomyces sp. NBC_01166]